MAAVIATGRRLRTRMPGRELVVQSVVNWRTVRGYGELWRGSSDWIGRPSRYAATFLVEQEYRISRVWRGARGRARVGKVILAHPFYNSGPVSEVAPVKEPPGRAKLAAIPTATGSVVTATIGIVLEAALKFSTKRDETVTITSRLGANHFSGKFRVVFDEAPGTIARHSKITPFDIAHTALNRLKRPLSRGSSPAGYPAEPLISYQINRQLSGWNLPPLVIRAFGAHCQ
jgi:hypothetical protein